MITRIHNIKSIASYNSNLNDVIIENVDSIIIKDNS